MSTGKLPTSEERSFGVICLKANKNIVLFVINTNLGIEQYLWMF